MPSARISTDPIVPLSSTPTPPTTAPSNNARRASLKILSRNIDQVVLGNLLFKTWYYSPYPDIIVLGEEHASNHANTASTLAAAKQHLQANNQINTNGLQGIAGDHSSSTTALRPAPTPYERLHICPYCFRYTPKATSYVQHLRRHDVSYSPYPELQPSTPSQTPRSNRNRLPTPSDEGSEEDASVWPVPETAIKVYEHNGYTVWDIDGEREKLYCQNLSLFGKLFLEQKSVFFDTGGFHYFVLTYTPPLSPDTDTSRRRADSSTKRTAGRRRTSSGATTTTPAAGPASSTTQTFTAAEASSINISQDINLRTQVLGFFSKENLSWDANNLACILVFPPYQHRNLGQLLMAVSYKLSGWEWEDSIIGGPEKPLSAMGRKSYLRFWSERVSRFMMGQTADADGRRVFDSIRRRKKVGFHKEEMTIKEIGDRTGMLAEDVIAALNEMGVLEIVVPKKKKRKSDGDESAAGGGEDTVTSSTVVHRSRVLEWADDRGVSLVSPVKEEGFLGEWALSEIEDDDDEEEEVEEEVVESE